MSRIPSQTPATPVRRALVLLLLLGASCGGAARRESEVRSDVGLMIRRGRFEEALARAEELQKEQPGNAQAEELLRQARLSWFLSRGRAATFDGRLDEALQHFERAREIAPESAIVRQWIDKTNRGIADHWLNVALDLDAAGDLDGAIAGYGKALDHMPGYASALREIEGALLVKNHRAAKGESYYVDGVRALSGDRLPQARWSFTATEKYLPEHEPAVKRRGQADLMIADQRLVVARNLEEAGLYAAAVREYQHVLRLDPENPEGLEGRNRVAPEAEARRLLNEAGMFVLRQRYDEALAQVDRAAALTTRQVGAVEAVREQVARERLETLYQRALSLERDQRYPAAVAAYGDLLAVTAYYKDAQARRDTLEEYVRLAERYYEQAAEESDPAQRLEYLRAIRGFWSEYRDVAEQIVDLEAQLPPETDEDEPDAVPLGSR